MSAAEDWADALKAGCGLMHCERPPGDPCVNVINGKPRELPHWNRVVRGRSMGFGPAHAGNLPPLMPGGESTSAQLANAREELASTRETLAVYRQELAVALPALKRTADERDQLADAVAGWVARFHAAYEALYIEEFDGDSCPDLETTIAYAIAAYRRVCESEAAAAEQISQLSAERDKAANTVGWLQAQNTVLLESRDLARAELASARVELTRLRTDLHAERETSAQLRADYTEAADELAELRAAQSWIVARDGGRYCERCVQEIQRGQAYVPPLPGIGLYEHALCPDLPEETTVPATADDGSRAETLLSLPLPDNDAEAATVRDYLVALLLVTWEDGPKRPFGNSGWHYDLYAPMVKAGLIPGELDSDGYVEDVDTRAADALVVEAIRALASDRGAR